MTQHNYIQPRLDHPQRPAVQYHRIKAPTFQRIRGSESLENELFNSEWRDPVALRFSQRTRSST